MIVLGGARTAPGAAPGRGGARSAKNTPARWRAEAGAIRDFIEGRCWSDELGSYVSLGRRVASWTRSVLLGALMDYPGQRDPQMAATIDAVGA